MAFTVQDDTGEVEGANSYATVEEFQAYHTDRGNDFVAYSEPQIQSALIAATDYLDLRFTFVGNTLTGRGQTTKWPRYDAWDRDDYPVVGVPKEIRAATIEYALRALSAPLCPDVEPSATGFPVQSVRNKLDPMEEAITYDTKASITLPAYPAVDSRLRKAGLVKSPSASGSVSRG